MQRQTKSVPESTLSTLVESGAIHTAYIVENDQGHYYLVLASGNLDYRLEKKRGGERLFKSLDAAAHCLRAIGITRFRGRLKEFRLGREPILD
ncbi:MAG: hypothetical protein OQK12_17760 [Motiliproteus sp.]|nr:hypothetical protein [Motiliproteus sp.]MCW9053524.1 hypothetical protein [Motiliproteus sp.]